MNIQITAYNLYKEDWLTRISEERQQKLIREYKKMSEKWTTNYKEWISYVDYVETVGYDGEIYVSFNEFVDNEYQEVEYIITILSSKSMLEDYYKDIQDIYNQDWHNHSDEIYYSDFMNDEEKMRDFYELTKEEFLASYSYMTEEEYNLTVIANAIHERETGDVDNE